MADATITIDATESQIVVQQSVAPSIDVSLVAAPTVNIDVVGIPGPQAQDVYVGSSQPVGDQILWIDTSV